MENTKQASRSGFSAAELTVCALFVALIAVGAFIKVPIPVCPFTLQYLFTVLAGALLGAKRGSLCVLVYVILGLIGLPIFAEGGGIWYIAKPTFGYLLGFAAGSYVTGKLIERMKTLNIKGLIAANFAGLMIVYAAGMVYYYIVCNFIIDTPIGLWPLFLYCFLLAVPGDICLCILAAFLTRRLRPQLASQGIIEGGNL